MIDGASKIKDDLQPMEDDSDVMEDDRLNPFKCSELIGNYKDKMLGRMEDDLQLDLDK